MTRTPSPTSGNPLAQTNNRLIDVGKELLGITKGDKSKSTIIKGQGTFDNEEWLQVEGEELVDERRRLHGIVQMDGTVEYDD